MRPPPDRRAEDVGVEGDGVVERRRAHHDAVQDRRWLGARRRVAPPLRLGPRPVLTRVRELLGVAGEQMAALGELHDRAVCFLRRDEELLPVG
jgi:hypothetical protein